MHNEGTPLENLTDLLIATLCSNRSTHLFRKIIRERQFKRYKENSVRVTLSRLAKKGYVSKTQKGWVVTLKGRERHKDRNLLGFIPSPFDKKAQDGVVIAFDIPERDRRIRHWLRSQIKIFGYKMLQQSLWIGPGPLPDKFLNRLSQLKIRDKVKTFRINK